MRVLGTEVKNPKFSKQKILNFTDFPPHLDKQQKTLYQKTHPKPQEFLGGTQLFVLKRRLTHLSLVLRARKRQALLDMDAPRRALTELHPAKELMERGRDGWPVEVLKRILVWCQSFDCKLWEDEMLHQLDTQNQIDCCWWFQIFFTFALGK